MLFEMKRFFDVEGGGGGAGNQMVAQGNQPIVPTNASTGNQAVAPTQGVNFEAWLKEPANAEIAKAYETHTQGLRSALNTERTARGDLEKQLRDLAKKAEAGSDAETKLTELANALADKSRQMQFFDAAHEAGVTNLKLAWLAARDAGLVSDKGEVDFDKLKAGYPELFGRAVTAPPVNGGAGNAQQPAKVDMNDVLRQAFRQK